MSTAGRVTRRRFVGEPGSVMDKGRDKVFGEPEAVRRNILIHEKSALATEIDFDGREPRWCIYVRISV